MIEETITILQKAHLEILELRRRNELLQAQVEIIAIFDAALRPGRAVGQTMCVDIAWEIQREVDRLISAQKAQSVAEEEGKGIYHDPGYCAPGCPDCEYVKTNHCGPNRKGEAYP